MTLFLFAQGVGLGFLVYPSWLLDRSGLDMRRTDVILWRLAGCRGRSAIENSRCLFLAASQSFVFAMAFFASHEPNVGRRKNAASQGELKGKRCYKGSAPEPR